MKNKYLILAMFVFLSLFLNPAFAQSKIKQDRAIQNGCQVITITNPDAGKDQKYLQKLDKGDTYKNYKLFTPKKLETIPYEDPKPLPKPAPVRREPDIYSRYDVSHIANAHKVLGPIIVSLADGNTLDISPIIMAEAKKNNLDPVLIKTVIKFESGFCPYAISPVGAGGLMQLMPDTAAGLGVSDIFSPYQNIAGGALYIRLQLNTFNNNVAYALAAYNAGPGAVEAYGGVPPYEETINYVNGIIADYLRSGGTLKGQSRLAATPDTLSKEEPEPRNVDIFSTLTRMKNKTRDQQCEIKD